VTNTTNPGFEAFVNSRIPMLEHDLAIYAAGPQRCSKLIWARRKYSFKHALFYQVERYLTNLRVYASEAALDYAADHWKGGSEALWTLHRDDQEKQEGCRISKSGLIWEHTYTGEMFFEAVLKLFLEGGGRVDPVRLQTLILDNLACAWVTRKEDSQLNKLGFRTYRGLDLGDAKEAYRKAGIRLRSRPTRLDGEG
jgi:hypothetical protein